MECVTVNILWKVPHSRWTLVLEFGCSALQLTFCKLYYTAGGQFYCRLNEVRYSDHYVDGTAQQVMSGIVAWMDLLQWTLNEIYEPRNYCERKEIYIFLFWILHWSMSCVLYFTMHKCNFNTSSVAKEARLFIPLFKSCYSFPHTQYENNSILLTCSTRETNTNIRFRIVRMCMNSWGIYLHSVTLIYEIECIEWELFWS